VREALFQVIDDHLQDARVLELFGGTGSLGLEALSRGASSAVFTETDRGALACLTENVAALRVVDRVTIHRRSAFRLPALSRGGPPFDLVFCDPPFRMLEDAAERRRLETLLSSLALSQLRTWGTTGMAIYANNPSGCPDSE